MPVTNPLDRIELSLQALIEEHLASLLPGGSTPGSLARQVVGAIQSNLVTSENQSICAPNLYTIQVSPAQINDWQANPALLAHLARHIQSCCVANGFLLESVPVVRLVLMDDLPPGEIEIHAAHSGNVLGQTAALPASSPGSMPPTARLMPQDAFLIINGSQTYPLRQTVVNIGRRLTNHVVVDDPRVSREHCQLRAVRGQYIVCDLNSTGGTFVNGVRISQRRLSPGDVISLAGVPIIYGEDRPGFVEDNLGSTAVIPPVDPLESKP